MFKLNNDLLNAIGINEINREYSVQLNNLLIQELINNSFENNHGLLTANLPNNPLFEIHPYKNDFELQNYDKYIIGTFPPINYLYDNPLISASGIVRIQQPTPSTRKLKKSEIPFYHGNKNLMWNFLLLYEEFRLIPQDRNISKEYLIEMLQEISINYGDIIDSTQRNTINGSYNGRDENLNNIFINNDLINHIINNHNVNAILFNTSSIYGMNGIQYNEDNSINVDQVKTFDLFVEGCIRLGYIVEISIQNGNHNTQFDWTNIRNLNLNQRRTKLIFKLRLKSEDKIDENNKIKEKIITIITPFSPAVAQRINILQNNPIVINWIEINNINSTMEMLRNIYISFRENNFEVLYHYNN